MWKAVGASAAGTSHVASSLPCQDAFAVGSASFGGEHIVYAALADGAGSAKHSRYGARLAVRAAARSLANMVRFGMLPRPEQMLDVLDSSLLAIERAAVKRDIPVREFASTLLVAAASERVAVFCQIGDGCWLVRSRGVLINTTWPSTGFYANETTFLTSSNWRRDVQVECIEEGIDALVGLTDGLQTLALNLAEKRVHSGFLEPLLRVVEGPTHAEKLAPALKNYLDSPTINQRTDDDKTLVMAVRSKALSLPWPSSIAADGL